MRLIAGLDHVQIAMPPGQEERARAFYQGVLGLQEVRKPDPLVPRGGCWFEGPKSYVHLGVEEDFQPARKAHVAFIVSDMAQLRSALERAGYEIVPDEVLPGVERFYCSDPFGNRLEFIRDGDGFSQRP